jgi:glycosyltransferase involved in cell wall biosynthesis
MMVFDYIQRYQLMEVQDTTFVAAARAAERVLVTTRFTENDALTYAGVDRSRVLRVPMLVPDFSPQATARAAATRPYFLWTTNRGGHKNHFNAISALRDYYEFLHGEFDCHVSGVQTESLFNSDLPQLALAGTTAGNQRWSGRIQVLGELPDHLYRAQLAGAEFLWHPGRIDNGTLAVVEAASLGVPSLSSRYPAMEEIDSRFNLHLSWMESIEPGPMASGLKWMEENAPAARTRLPAPEDFDHFSVEACAAEYWNAIRECL